MLKKVIKLLLKAPFLLLIITAIYIFTSTYIIVNYGISGLQFGDKEWGLLYQLIFPGILIYLCMEIDALLKKEYRMILTGGLIDAKEPWLFLFSFIPVVGTPPLSFAIYRKLKELQKKVDKGEVLVS